nr:MAG TPA: hypothetical protein [Caudoviricetes sp.]
MRVSYTNDLYDATVICVKSKKGRYGPAPPVNPPLLPT